MNTFLKGSITLYILMTHHYECLQSLSDTHWTAEHNVHINAPFTFYDQQLDVQTLRAADGPGPDISPEMQLSF